MADKASVVPISKIFSQAPDVNKEYIKVMLKEDVAVLCINREAQKKRSMPFKALYDNNQQFWQQGGKWEYFLLEETFAEVKEKIVGSNFSEWKPPDLSAIKQEIDTNLGYGSEHEVISAMSNEKRVEKINELSNQLNDLISKKVKTPEKITEVLVETTKKAALINHATILGAMQLADDEARKATQSLVTSTSNMVKSSVYLVSENLLNDDLMNSIVQKSNGTIVQHMTRVYLSGLSFLAFYNKLVSTSSIINKLRVTVEKKYSPFYCALMPDLHPQHLTLEKIFYGGMRAIPYEVLHVWGIGFLIHDIGKATAVEYHEGEEAYNRDIVMEHVKLGYTSIMNKTNYPREAGLIAGYHHEYYGDNSGYGFFRSYLDSYKKVNPSARQDYFIAYELEPMIDYRAKAFFPAKILEIIDIYDSVTDPNRKYRKAMTPEEALAMMREQFIDKNLKIDPVLFDIFVAFVNEKGKKK